MIDEQATFKEADTLCRYLSKRAVSPALAHRYKQALEANNLDPVPGIGTLRLHLSRDYRQRLTIMSALIETDPGYNALFFNPRSRVIAYAHAVLTGSSGLMKALAGRILFR